REPMVDQGLQFARRVDAMGRIYFVSNPGDRPVDGWVRIDSHAATVMAFDPMDGRRGRLTARGSGSAREIYLQMPAGASLIVAESPAADETFDAFRAAGDPAPVPRPPPADEPFAAFPAAGAPATVAGSWTVRFLEGGPRLPSRQTVDRLGSWTTFRRGAGGFFCSCPHTT